MLYIGIDIHKRSHEVVILEDLGKPLGKSFKIGNSHYDLKHLFEQIHTLNPKGKPYHVALGAVANKLLHIIYAALRDNKPYYQAKIQEILR